MKDGANAPASFRPEFLWDPDRLRLVWANEDGLAFWEEEGQNDLAERFFAPDSETARVFARRIAEVDAGAVAEARLSLNPSGTPVTAVARCAPERMADGRRVLRVSLIRLDSLEDACVAMSAKAFDACPYPQAIFDQAGAALLRNDEDRRTFGDAADLEARYDAPALARRAIAAVLADGSFSHGATLRGSLWTGRYRVSFRRSTHPSSGAPIIVTSFVERIEPASGRSMGVGAAAMARIAHDLRSPLTAIQGFAEFMALSGDAVSVDQRSAYLADIQTASARMLALADRIVAMGEADARGVGGAIEVVDLCALVDEAARLNGPKAKAAGVSIEIAPVAGAASAVADPNVTMRVLQNLIENALSHGAASGGQVRLTAIPAENGAPAALEVRDDGPGMDEQALAAALRPYEGSSRADKAGGLGLSNCLRLAAAMAGRLEIETAPGEGFAARLVFAPA